MIRAALTLAAAIALALPAAAAPGDPAPRAGIASLEQLAQPLPQPYDESADATRAVAAAQAAARRSHKLLLIDFGGNWCLDCRIFSGVIELPRVHGWVMRHYQVVTVDVGRFDKNMDLPARYGAPRLRAVPAVLVVDPATGRMRNLGSELALGDARSLTPQAIVDWLAKWTK